MAAGDGLISMKPTSITHAGTSAVINSDGGVDFTAVTSLSLNGVFTGDYDNYLIVISNSATSNAEFLSYRMRAAGSDASGSNYTAQRLSGDSTFVAGGRFVSYTESIFALVGNTLINGFNLHMYGPYLAQPTASRSTTITTHNNARIYDCAGTHSLSTSYDGITFFPSGGNITGTVHVFGYEE